VTTGIYDDSGVPPLGTAVYSLSDPRDLRDARYIGQTGNPRRRLLQHLSTAQLWIPDERPWWMKSPRLRPLSQWIRTLYADERRLPIMLVHQWLDTETQARIAERSRIFACMESRLSLLNVEMEILGRQHLLL
jgi:hypothetical protein